MNRKTLKNIFCDIIYLQTQTLITTFIFYKISFQILAILASFNYQQLDECINYNTALCNLSIQDIFNITFDQKFLKDLQNNKLLDELLYLNSHNTQNVQNVTQSKDDQIIIAGDLHGDGQNMIKLINQTFENNTKYIFLGDYVDRGNESLSIIMSVLLLKLYYPEQFIFLSGNHEDLKVNKKYGFLQDLEYYNLTNYQDKIKAFYDSLPIASFLHTKHIDIKQKQKIPEEQKNIIQAMYNKTDIYGIYLLVHGGAFFYYQNYTDDQNKSLYQLLQDVDTNDKSDSILKQIHWNDPNKEDRLMPSPRRAGLIYGQSQAHEFMIYFGIDGIFRGHQVVKQVRDDYNDGTHFTVYSQSNKGSYIKMNDTGTYFYWINEQQKNKDEI